MTKIVTSDGDTNIGEGDIKVDTTPQNDEDVKNQQDAAKVMGVKTEESGSEVVDDQKQDDQDGEKPEEKKDEEYGYVNPEDQEEDPLEKINKLQTDFEDYKKETNEKLTQSQAEAIRLKNENDRLLRGDTEKTEETESKEMQKTFIDFCSSHSDVLGTEIIDDYKKFIASGNNAFIFNNPFLKAMAESIEITTDTLPFADRVENAFKIAFADKIAEQRGKQEKVKTEIQHQTLQKSATGDTKISSSKTSAYTPEQEAFAEKMGVELK